MTPADVVAAGAWGASGEGSWYDAILVMGALAVTAAVIVPIVERVHLRLMLRAWLRELFRDPPTSTPG